jgi:hypothetical protein
MAMTATGTSVYVYGVTWADGLRAPRARRSKGIAGGAVGTVEHGELAAVVSPGPDGPVRTKRSELLCHLEVVRDVFESKTVLPLQFGSVFPNRDAVADELLSSRHEELVGLLEQFEGLAELRVRATYREEEILAEVVASDPKIARLRELTQGAGRGADPLRLQLGEAVARALTARRGRDAHAISAALLEGAHDAVSEEPRTEYELLRASYLVERGRIREFDKRVSEIAGGERERMSFTYTGPLPPHSFVALSPRRS